MKRLGGQGKTEEGRSRGKIRKIRGSDEMKWY